LQGLDYVVATACTNNMRVVLTLTNYLTAFGGMATWVQWFQGDNISDFYKSLVIRHAPLHLRMNQYAQCVVKHKQKLCRPLQCCVQYISKVHCMVLEAQIFLHGRFCMHMRRLDIWGNLFAERHVVHDQA